MTDEVSAGLEGLSGAHLKEAARSYVAESRWIRRKHRKVLAPAVLERLEAMETAVSDRMDGDAGALKTALGDLVQSIEVDLAHYRRSRTVEFLELLGFAFLLALLIRTFVVQAYVIPSESMVPTLLRNDYLLVWKPAYGIKVPFRHDWLVKWSRPKRWDVVVFVPPQELGKKYLDQEDFIKRVVGLPGDRIELIDRVLYLNGEPVRDEWAHWIDGELSGHGEFGPFVIPPGHYFMMGDNRDRSLDSRSWGTVPEDALVGPAAFIYFSTDSTSPGGLTGLVQGIVRFPFDTRWRRLGRIIR